MTGCWGEGKWGICGTPHPLSTIFLCSDLLFYYERFNHFPHANDCYVHIFPSLGVPEALSLSTSAQRACCFFISKRGTKWIFISALGA